MSFSQEDSCRPTATLRSGPTGPARSPSRISSHRRPRRFSGGDLLLYDTDVDAKTGHTGAFSRITPLRNGIIFFPSNCYHQVTPVQCETDDFEDARWVLNGHVWRLAEAPAPERNPA